MNDKILILISVFIGASLWVYVYLSENRELVITVPVHVVEEKTGTMSFIKPREVSVRISGPQGLVSKAADQAVVNLNLSGYPTGDSFIKLSSRDLKIVGANIVDITPSNLEVNIQNTVRRSLPVTPLILDKPPKGYKVSNIIVTPNFVEVEGVYNSVTLLTSVQTKHIDVAQSKGDKTVNVDIIDYDGIKKVVPAEVTVHVEIVEDILLKSISAKPVCATGTGDVDREFQLVTLMIKGRRDKLEELNTNEPLVTVDCNTYRFEEKGGKVAIDVKRFDGIDVKPSPSYIIKN